MKTVDVTNQKPKFVYPYLLLHPQIPKPLHGVNPRTILGEAWWNEKRKEAYKENNYCCWACGSSERQPLEAHECYEINYIMGSAKLVQIVALCDLCHAFIHKGRIANLVEAKKMTIEEANEIMKHGEMVTKSIDPLRLPDWLIETLSSRDGTLNTAKWTDWYLELEGKKYHSPHKSFEEWAAYYRNKD